MGFWKRCQGQEEDEELEEETGSGIGGQNWIQIPSTWQDKIGFANFDQDQALLSFEDTNPWSVLNLGGSFKEKEVVPRSSLGGSRNKKLESRSKSRSRNNKSSCWKVVKAVGCRNLDLDLIPDL